MMGACAAVNRQPQAVWPLSHYRMAHALTSVHNAPRGHTRSVGSRTHRRSPAQTLVHTHCMPALTLLPTTAHAMHTDTLTPAHAHSCSHSDTQSTSTEPLTHLDTLCLPTLDLDRHLHKAINSQMYCLFLYTYCTHTGPWHIPPRSVTLHTHTNTHSHLTCTLPDTPPLRA